MAVDNALDGGQANAGSGVFGLFMHALESAEQFLGKSHVETHSIIAHEESLAVFHLGLAEFDARRRAWTGKFPGVAEQVGQHNFEQPRVAQGRQTGLDDQLNLACGLGCLQAGSDGLRQAAEIDRDSLHFAAGYP